MFKKSADLRILFQKKTKEIERKLDKIPIKSQKSQRNQKKTQIIGKKRPD